jgi:hypothetical protein
MGLVPGAFRHLGPSINNKPIDKNRRAFHAPPMTRVILPVPLHFSHGAPSTFPLPWQ